MSVRILIGDCRVRMAELPDASVDSVVCDPPYELGFMSKAWDSTGVANDPAMWRQVLRVLKPGGHLLAFSGTRTYHRMVCAIEDAGFEIRDQLAWVYGSGFPKSLDVSKQIDKAAGAEREVIGRNPNWRDPSTNAEHHARWNNAVVTGDVTAPATAAAREWQGWGTALKPSWESICLAQKPYDFRQLCGILAHKIAEAVCQLPSLAKDAEQSSWLSLSVSAEGFGSAQWNAVAECNTPGALCALMDMLPSGSALPSSLSIASSWLNTLGALLALENTFTIETASSLTTDLKTLNSLLSRNTPLTIAQAAIPQHGEPCVASLAASLFSAVSARLHFIRGASVAGPATSQDEDWDIRPSLAPICLARKPLIGTVAANVLAHGTGALNIDGCRIATDWETDPTKRGWQGRNLSHEGGSVSFVDHDKHLSQPNDLGRWPANLCHDGSEEVLAGFPAEAGAGQRVREFPQGYDPNGKNEIYGDGLGGGGCRGAHGDSGSAARFFYCAKATTDERGEGNNHPTVKPISLMRWLVRLVTPKGGTVLDPFMGSGSTLLAAEAEQFNAIGCEMSPEYAAIAEGRLKRAGGMFADVVIDRGLDRAA